MWIIYVIVMVTTPGCDCIVLPLTVPVRTVVHVEAPSGAVEPTVKDQVPVYVACALKVNLEKVHAPFTVVPVDHLIVSLQPVATNAAAPLFTTLAFTVLDAPRASEKLLGENVSDSVYVVNAMVSGPDT